MKNKLKNLFFLFFLTYWILVCILTVSFNFKKIELIQYDNLYTSIKCHKYNIYLFFILIKLLIIIKVFIHIIKIH